MYDGKFVVDTNVFLKNPNVFEEYEKIIIPSAVLEEIDGLKKSDEIGFNARQASRAIEKHKKDIIFDIKDIYDNMPDGWDENKRDNKIIMCAKEHGAKIISNDINVRIKAESLGIMAFWNNGDNSEIDEYKGWIEIEMSNEELAIFYENDIAMGFGLIDGQYLLIKDPETGNIIDKYKFKNGKLVKLKYSQLNSKAMGKIKPRNVHQELLFDLLQDKSKTVYVCTGGMGVGKDIVMLSHALDLIERNQFKKLVFCRNNINVKDSQEVGFLKGSLNDKLMPWAQIISDHVGGQFGLDMMINNGIIELQHLGFLRGRDIKDSIIYCTESENMTKEHIQLLLARVGEGSVIMFNGDFKQVDNNTFKRNNGLNIMIDRLKGQENFGVVKLISIERSKTARMADLLD